MGNCASAEHLTKEEKVKQKVIEENLRTVRRKLGNELNLLLLGAGESGKTTLAKQMKLIHKSGFTDSERKSFKDVVHSNVVLAMRSLVLASQRFGYQLADDNKEIARKFTTTAILAEQELTNQMAQDIKKLWADPVIQDTFKRANEFQITDSAVYYFEHIDRITGDFLPTDQDILRVRAKTTGISEIQFSMDSHSFRMIDVGGQRSERKKWIHCFQDVTAVIFCTSLSEYDMKLYEDENVNRMHESLKLFEEILNSRWFVKTSIILFLNKKDIFEKKIKISSLKTCFPEYSGPANYNEASTYIATQFESLNRSEKKFVYTHKTCAIDTENVRFVFESVKDILLHQTLDSSGF